MEKKNEFALIETLETMPITKETLVSGDFNTKYQYLLEATKKLSDIKKMVDDSIKQITKDNYLNTGEASIVTDDFRFTYVAETTRESVDTKKLKAENPEIYKAYTKVSKVSESFKVTPIKKKEDNLIED